MNFASDRIVFGPPDVDLSRSPLRGLKAETYILGAFNPGFTRLPDGNLLMMVRVAEALRNPIEGDFIRSIRWDRSDFVLDAYELTTVDVSDPRTFRLRGQ